MRRFVESLPVLETSVYPPSRMRVTVDDGMSSVSKSDLTVNETCSGDMSGHDSRGLE